MKKKNIIKMPNVDCSLEDFLASSIQGLNAGASEFVPRGVSTVILRPPVRRGWQEVMNDIITFCRRRYTLAVCKKTRWMVTYHPNLILYQNKKIDTECPAIWLSMNQKNNYCFYYLEGRIWVECHVELGRAPLGANYFNWSIENLAEITEGIERLISFASPVIA